MSDAPHTPHDVSSERPVATPAPVQPPSSPPYSTAPTAPTRVVPPPVGPPSAPPPEPSLGSPREPEDASGPPPAPPADPTPPDRPRAPRWVTPLVVLAALALFAGGALSGWAIAERGDSEEPASATVPEEPATTPVSGPVADGADEPIAAVADAVAPSVVQIETNAGLGSGVVYDDQGHILTAAHVLDGADQLRVRLADGTLVPAEIVGSNPATDVGVVKIERRDDLVPATLGVDAEVTVGQLAVAVGSPFGLEQTVTSGIVSAVDRPVETEGTSIVGMIQTDASINPGNSGGVLADRKGRIIGINDAIRTAGGGNEGVGFAIPIDLAVRVADQIIAGEDIRAGLLGVTVSDPTDGPAGALVAEVLPDGPASGSGLQVGDLITSMDGERIARMQDLRARVLAREPGETVILEVLRDDRTVEIEVTLGSATG